MPASKLQRVERMSHYIHHVPGRLRVKSPGLKRNAHAAEETRDHMARLLGVESTEVNTVTGSLVVKYDTRLVGGHTLINTLRSLGHLLPHHGHGEIHQSGSGIGQKVSDTVVNKLLETVIERSATALIAAII